MNIKCSVSGCVDSVIGQCPGYEDNCGKYYCESHSVNGLCLDCAQEKKAHEIYKDYLTTAKSLRRKAAPVQAMLRLAPKWLAIYTGVFIIALLPMCSIYLLSLLRTGSSAEPLNSTLSVLLVISTLCPCLSTMVMIPIVGIRAHQYSTKLVNAEVAEIDVSKPGFANFYENWETERRKDVFVAGLGIAAAIAAGMVVSTLEDAVQRDRIRRAVDESLKRHGY